MQVVLYGTLTKEVLRRKAAQQYDEESLNLAAKLLEQNPEVYTVWNYRRGALTDILDVSARSQIWVAVLHVMPNRIQMATALGKAVLHQSESCPQENNSCTWPSGSCLECTCLFKK